MTMRVSNNLNEKPAFLSHRHKRRRYALGRNAHYRLPAVSQQADHGSAVVQLNRARAGGGSQVIEQRAVPVEAEAHRAAAVEALHAFGIAQSRLKRYRVVLARDF